MLGNGYWIDFKGWKIWVWENRQMTPTGRFAVDKNGNFIIIDKQLVEVGEMRNTTAHDKLKEAGEIYNSGWLKENKIV